MTRARAAPVRLLGTLAKALTDPAKQVYGFVAALVDGQRSTADIAAHLAEKRLMSLEEALPAVRGFLLQLHEQAAQRRRW